MVSQFTSTTTPEPFICVSPAMRRVLEDAARAALTDRPVQLLGESGCGKGRIAREIHDRSARRDRPFVLWSAPEGSDSLGQHDLFGHVRGAFTGADRDGIGLLEVAHTGTLVIDDVDKMDLGLQGAMLRFLDSWSLRRLGSTSLIRVDIRLILTTNRPLDAVVGEKRFLPDLYWRLRGLRIEVPPLRERVEDLPPLIEHFTTRFAADFAKPAPRYSKAALDILLKARWPGNIRQLSGTVENLVFHAAQDRPIGPEAVLRELNLRGSSPDSGRTPGAGRRGIAKDVLLNALERSHWNSVQAAAELGYPLRTVRRWMEKCGISRGKRKASSNGHGIPG